MPIQQKIVFDIKVSFDDYICAKEFAVFLKKQFKGHITGTTRNKTKAQLLTLSCRESRLLDLMRSSRKPISAAQLLRKYQCRHGHVKYKDLQDILDSMAIKGMVSTNKNANLQY